MKLEKKPIYVEQHDDHFLVKIGSQTFIYSGFWDTLRLCRDIVKLMWRTCRIVDWDFIGIDCRT